MLGYLGTPSPLHCGVCALRTEEGGRVDPSMRWCHDPPPMETQRRGATKAALVDLREWREVNGRRPLPGEQQHLRASPPPPPLPFLGTGLGPSSVWHSGGGGSGVDRCVWLSLMQRGPGVPCSYSVGLWTGAIRRVHKGRPQACGGRGRATRVYLWAATALKRRARGVDEPESMGSRGAAGPPPPFPRRDPLFAPLHRCCSALGTPR